MKLRAKRIIFVVAICVAAICAIFSRSSLRFKTDLGSLVNLEQDSGWPVQSIIDRFSSVMNIVVQSNDRFAAEQVAYQIRDIVKSTNFPELDIMINNLSPHALVSALGSYHNVMISSADRQLLQKQKFADLTNNARIRLESSVAPNLLPLSQDPFLLFTNYVYEMGNGGTNWVTQNGVLWQYVAHNHFYMLPVSISALENENLVKTIEQLKHKIAKVKTDNVQIYIGGAPLHTAEMFRHSKIELGIISFLALFAVLVLNYLLFHSIKTIIPVTISLGVGYFVGTIALFLCFGEPHILVFVFGTSLVGLGVDYAFHAMYTFKGNSIKETQKNILLSLLTTVICFIPLLFADINLLQQISVFTIAGLCAIYVFIKLFINWYICEPNNTVKFINPIKSKCRSYIALGVALVSCVACIFARIENNMSAIYRPMGDLATAEKLIGELNASGKSAFLVVRGDDIQSVLETEENIRDSGVEFFGVSSIIPSLKRQHENQNMVQDLYKSQAKNVRQILGLKQIPKFNLASDLFVENNDIGLELQRFIFNIRDKVYSVSFVPADALIQDDNAKIIMPAQQMQNQIERYSNETYNLLIICGVALMLFLFALYRGRAFRYLMPSLFGVVVSIGLLTIFGIPITFFHLLGLFIVVGLGMDYAIFHINMRQNAELRPVFYSFLTSFVGFGLLAFTSFFLIASMGTILAIGIAVSYFASLYLFRN